MGAREMTYQIQIRSQHAKKGKSGFHGPDTYVAVTVAPDGVETPYCLNSKILKKRGIKLHYIGEGYNRYRGPRSQLGKALAAAERYIDTTREAIELAPCGCGTDGKHCGCADKQYCNCEHGVCPCDECEL